MADLAKYQMTQPAPIIWAHVVTPKRANEQLGIPSRYEVTFLFTEDHPDFKPLSAALARAMKGLKAEGRKVPVERGDKLADAAPEGKPRDCLRGKLLVKAHLPLQSRKKEDLLPPRLYVAEGTRYIQHANRQDAAPYFYNGVLALGEFTVIPFEGMGGGASLWINEIVSFNQGDRLNIGSGDPESKWGTPSQYIGKLSATDPTAGAEDSISY